MREMVRKMKHISVIAAIVMCMVAGSVEASEVTVFAEDFSTFSSVGYTATSCNGWTLDRCSNGIDYANNNNVMLIVGNSAQSPIFERLSGDAKLSFKYRTNTATPNINFKVVICGGGSFFYENESTDEISFVALDRTPREAELAITNGSPTTYVKFVVPGSDDYIRIDDVIILAESVSAPTFSPSEGYFTENQTVTITDNEGGATIYYTTDGTEPTSSSTLYTAPITISTPTTLKAIACKDGKSSAVTTAEYYVGSYIYAESFNKCDAAGGNDGNFSGKGGIAQASDLDNSATASNLYTAQKCVLFSSDYSSSTYTTPSLSLGKTGLLTFRIAGSTGSGTPKMTVKLYEYGGVGMTNQATSLSEDFEATAGQWTECTMPLSTLYKNSTRKLEFSSTSGVYLDDILLVDLPAELLELKEEESNSSFVSTNNGQVRNVKLTRTIRGGIWNTMCLPFSVTKHDLLALSETGIGLEIGMYTYEKFEDDKMKFKSVNEVAAGEPFLLKLNTTFENPTFWAVTVGNQDSQTITSGEVSFIGTYGPVALNTNGTELFLDTYNNLHTPSAGSNTINGMRAFIRRSSNNVRIGLSLEDESAGISSVEVDDSAKHPFYTLGGLQVEAPTSRGIYVTRGRKVVIR